MHSLGEGPGPINLARGGTVALAGWRDAGPDDSVGPGRGSDTSGDLGCSSAPDPLGLGGRCTLHPFQHQLWGWPRAQERGRVWSRSPAPSSAFRPLLLPLPLLLPSPFFLPICPPSLPLSLSPVPLPPPFVLSLVSAPEAEVPTPGGRGGGSWVARNPLGGPSRAGTCRTLLLPGLGLGPQPGKWVSVGRGGRRWAPGGARGLPGRGSGTRGCPARATLSPPALPPSLPVWGRAGTRAPDPTPGAFPPRPPRPLSSSPLGAGGALLPDSVATPPCPLVSARASAPHRPSVIASISPTPWLGPPTPEHCRHPLPSPAGPSGPSGPVLSCRQRTWQRTLCHLCPPTPSEAPGGLSLVPEHAGHCPGAKTGPGSMEVSPQPPPQAVSGAGCVLSCLALPCVPMNYTGAPHRALLSPHTHTLTSPAGTGPSIWRALPHGHLTRVSRHPRSCWACPQGARALPGSWPPCSLHPSGRWA